MRRCDQNIDITGPDKKKKKKMNNNFLWKMDSVGNILHVGNQISLHEFVHTVRTITWLKIFETLFDNQRGRRELFFKFKNR